MEYKMHSTAQQIIRLLSDIFLFCIQENHFDCLDIKKAAQAYQIISVSMFIETVN